MDVALKISSRFCDDILPMLKDEAEYAYILTMVIMSVKTADKQWHKTNLFFSYLKALLFVRGADVILNLCTGKSPIDPLTSNLTMLTVAIAWWLVLFVPFDIFNNILNVEVGDLKPVLLLINMLTIFRQITAVDAAVASSLRTYPGSYIAIFLGTLAGNGCLIVSTVFGDFARSISNHKMTTTAFVAAFTFTLFKLVFPKLVPTVVVVTFCTALLLLLELLDAFDVNVDLFDPLYDVIRRIVVTCDLFN